MQASPFVVWVTIFTALCCAIILAYGGWQIHLIQSEAKKLKLAQGEASNAALGEARAPLGLARQRLERAIAAGSTKSNFFSEQSAERDDILRQLSSHDVADIEQLGSKLKGIGPFGEEVKQCAVDFHYLQASADLILNFEGSFTEDQQCNVASWFTSDVERLHSRVRAVHERALQGRERH